MSGFFTRRKHHERNGSARTSSDFQIPRIETSRASVDRPADSRSSTNESATDFVRPTVISQDSKSFFRIPRRKKASSLVKDDPRAAERNASMEQVRLSSQTTRSPFEGILRPAMSTKSSSVSVAASISGNAIMAATTSLAAPGSPRVELFNPLEVPLPLSRQESTRSVQSYRSTYSTPASDQSLGRTADLPPQMKTRGRSLTYAGSEGQRKASSNGRNTKFFSMNRLRRDVDETSLFRPISREFSPPPSPQKADMTRILPSLPLQAEHEDTGMYLAKLELHCGMHKTLVASILATSDDSFHYQCLQRYMQQFDFVNDPLDMALRKFLMDTHLPKETQQIDRVLNAFSERYQICNPRLYDSQVTPYVLSFALIMLHTDRFNQNNKVKMTKAQFLRNTMSEHTEQVSSDVLEYFYDNIISTPFILVDDDADSPALEKSTPTTPNEGLRSGNIGNLMNVPVTNGTTFGRRSLDLYPLIMENRLNSLRPQLGPILEHSSVLSYTGTLPVINVAKLHAAFTNPATLQLISARSRPEAFVSDHSMQHPLDSEPGLVDIQITKIGILRKREQKKAGSKPVYREWGVMLTPSQLLLFKNIAWVRHYMHQIRDRHKDEPLILDPPVHNYSPDTYMPTSDTVAMYDSSASKKATHFCFFGRGGEQTHLMASTEDEMNDWIAKINYAAAFHTVGVRIRGTAAFHAKESPSHLAQRLQRHASNSTTSTFGGSTASQAEVALARQTILRSKIEDMDTRLASREKQLALLQQQGRNLCTLTPIQPRTRASVISAAGALSAKMSWAKMELIKTQCHRDILAKDLELETVPSASVFTLPVRARTPSSEVSTPKTSPSKNKLGSAVGSLMRQVSTDTMRRRPPRFLSGSDISKVSIDQAQVQAQSRDIPASPAVMSPEMLDQLDFTPETLGQMFSNSLEHEEVARPATSGQNPYSESTASEVLPSSGPRTAPGLKLSLSFPKRNKGMNKNKRDNNDHDDISLISSPSSGRSSGHFILHGRKVSVVQTPQNLLGSTKPYGPEISPRPSRDSSHSRDSSVDVFLDADENLPASPK